MANENSITAEQIETLRTEAGQVGDLEIVAVCAEALGGNSVAVEECERVIDAAEAQTDAPDFDDVSAGLASGVYSAENLNPPSGDDCTHLLVRDDGSLGWCNPDGNDCTTFSVAELCESDTVQS